MTQGTAATESVSARQINTIMFKYGTLSAIPAALMVGLYAYTLLDLSAGEWRIFLAAIGLYSALAVTAAEVARRKFIAPLGRYIEKFQSKEGATREETSVAFATTIDLPRRMLQTMLIIWASAGPALPLLSALLGGTGWLSLSRLAVLLVAVSTGGVAAAALLFFFAKRELAGLRELSASEILDPEERRARVRPMSLGLKLQCVVGGICFSSIVFVIGLSSVRAHQGVDEVALSWHQKIIERIGPGANPREFEVLESRLAGDADLLPFPIEVEMIRSAADLEAASNLGRIFEQVAAGAFEGTERSLGESSVRTWRALPGGGAIVISTPRDALRAPVSGMYGVLGAMLLISGLVSLGVAYLMASDVRESVLALRSEAERMALGDLRRGRVLESEDELGDLARAFERMGGALRATVGRVAEAADRVDSAAVDISAVTQGVQAASADQVRRIQQASELMTEIKGQVSGVTESAQALNVSVEESSSSILELGAAGDELNDTASVLSEKVDEVSTSIEQMVRSVKQVGTSSESLADFAGETSSSMEEMASAMRVVDTTAEKAADLSRGVVVSAENGQTKVSQTISGMEAIRDATDSAESVILGLGARAKEIGAILDVIDDVADETNLLALNAAIIAAQAGEHGRAFSVVADEIKELADRVLASTKEIGGLIRAVQEESQNATGAIEVGSSSVASGVELSAEAGVSLEEITRSSRESGDRISEIVSAVREQTKAASHVVELMERVRGGVDQIRAAGEEQDRGNEVVHRSSVTMREVAQQVHRTTEEQSRGFGRIRESVEGVREAVEQINGSLQDQSRACSQVAEFLEQVYERTQSNEEAGRRMNESTRGLVTQAEALREDVAKFQI